LVSRIRIPRVKTYFDLGGAGLDTLQLRRCAPDGDDTTAAICASDPPTEDLGNNTVTK
jgi:hypothetical protein